MKQPIDEEIFKIATEIEGLVDDGNVVAIACVLVLANGSITTKIRFTDNQKFPLVAGARLLDNAVVQLACTGKEEQRGP